MGKEVKIQPSVQDRLLVLASGVEWVGIARMSLSPLTANLPASSGSGVARAQGAVREAGPSLAEGGAVASSTGIQQAWKGMAPGRLRVQSGLGAVCVSLV